MTSLFGYGEKESGRLAPPLGNAVRESSPPVPLSVPERGNEVEGRGETGGDSLRKRDRQDWVQLDEVWGRSVLSVIAVKEAHAHDPNAQSIRGPDSKLLLQAIAC